MITLWSSEIQTAAHSEFVLFLNSYAIFSKRLKNEFETAVVNEPSVFELLKVYCISLKNPTFKEKHFAFAASNLGLSYSPCSFQCDFIAFSMCLLCLFNVPSLPIQCAFFSVVLCSPAHFAFLGL